MRTQLVNQGINVGNEAYSRAEQDLVANRDRALRDAYSAALAEGRNDLSTQLGIRQQGIQDYLLERTQPLTELATYLQGSPASQGPQSSPVTQYQVAPADVQGAYNAQYQGALNNYNTRVGANNSKLGATAGLAGALGGGYLAGGAGAAAAVASDINLKTDIIPLTHEGVLEGVDKITISRWRYKQGVPHDDGLEHIGCMAQDFEEIFGLGDGRMIPVVDAIGVCMASIKALSSRVKALEAA